MVNSKNIGVNYSALCGLALLCVLTGCQGSLREQVDPGTPAPTVAVRVPFVEAVRFPTNIHAGDVFTIEMDISADQAPECLRTPEHPFPELEIRHWIQPPYAGWLMVGPWRLADPVTGASPVSTIHYRISFSDPGTYLWEYETADTRANGGVAAQLQRGELTSASRPASVVTRKAEFTVLPAP
jgi:hypothetical protein